MARTKGAAAMRRALASRRRIAARETLGIRSTALKARVADLHESPERVRFPFSSIVPCLGPDEQPRLRTDLADFLLGASGHQPPSLTIAVLRSASPVPSCSEYADRAGGEVKRPDDAPSVQRIGT